jgi:hypothetical protein
MQCSTVSCSIITGSRLPAARFERHLSTPKTWIPNSTRTDTKPYNRYRATPIRPNRSRPRNRRSRSPKYAKNDATDAEALFGGRRSVKHALLPIKRSRAWSSNRWCHCIVSGNVWSGRTPLEPMRAAVCSVGSEKLPTNTS